MELKYIKKHSRYTSKGVVFAKIFPRTIRSLLGKLVSGKGSANGIELLTTFTKKYNKAKHSTFKLIPVKASSKKNENDVLEKLKNKRDRRTQMIKVADLVGTADLTRMFPKGNITSWSHKIYSITDFINDTT